MTDSDLVTRLDKRIVALKVWYDGEERQFDKDLRDHITSSPPANSEGRGSMTTPKEDVLVALAERCEAATGPDRELDWRIYRDIYYPGHLLNKDPARWQITTRGSVTEPCKLVAFEGFEAAPAYTASLDAALTLVPGQLCISRGSMAAVAVVPDAYGNEISATAITLELALCAAALRARSQAKGEDRL